MVNNNNKNSDKTETRRYETSQKPICIRDKVIWLGKSARSTHSYLDRIAFNVHPWEY